MSFVPLIAILPFITPAIFGIGVAATSVPIVIHLLSKRRFRVIAWAAMDFLLAAQRRNARRLQFQKWLLLLLRIAALLILAAAIAQFAWNSALAGTIFGTQQRAAVLVWDDSYSMGYHSGTDATHFERSRKLILAWLETLPASEKVALIMGSTGAEPVIPRLTLDQHAVQRAVETAQLSDSGTDLATAIDKATDALNDVKDSTPTRQIFVLTDGTMASANDNGDATAGSERLRKAVAATKGIADLKFIDLGDAEQGNVGIVGLTPKKPVVVAGEPAEWQIEIQNAANHPQSALAVQLLVDGVAVQTPRSGKIDAGGRSTVVVSQAIATAGRHLVEARLVNPVDPLEIDDVRREMITVKTEVPVLLVDGNPGDRQGAASTLYVQGALERNVSEVFSPHVITELELPRTPLAQYGIVVLSDTAAPEEGVANNLKKFVEAGGLLLVFPGNRTVPADMNRALGPGGAGLLPAQFGAAVKLESARELGQGLHFDVMNYAHPVLAQFAHGAHDAANTGLTSVQTTEYLKLLLPENGGVETILKYTADENASSNDPAVVLGTVGRGRVVQFASTADNTWNVWGPKPSFPEFMDGLVYYALPHDDGGYTLQVGEQLNLGADVAAPGTWTGPRGINVNVTTQLEKDENREHIRSGPLKFAGLYQPAGTSQPVLAVNPDPAEVDVRHLNASQFAEASGADVTAILSNPSQLEQKTVVAADVAGGDFGRNLIPIALVLLLAETLFARAFSMYR